MRTSLCLVNRQWRWGKNCAQWESTLNKKLWSGWPLEAEGVRFHRKMDVLVITCVAPSGRRAPKFNLFPQTLRALDMYFKGKCDCKNVTTNIDYEQIQASKLFAACCGVNAAENIEFLEETAGAVPPRTNENKSECLEKECERRRSSPRACIFISPLQTRNIRLLLIYACRRWGARGRQFPLALWSNLFQERGIE